MILRFRTLTFLLFVITLSGFLSVFSFHAYHATEKVLKEEVLASLSQSAGAISHELDTYLRLVDQELHGLKQTPELQYVMENGGETSLRKLIMETEHPASMSRYQFIVLSSLDGSQCYLIKSRLINIGSEVCRELYQGYTKVMTQEWNLYRSGQQVLLAKDYLVISREQKVIGRMIGGIKLSNNKLLLSQLVNRAVVDLDSAHLTLSGSVISAYSPIRKALLIKKDKWQENRSIRQYKGDFGRFGKGLELSLTAAQQNTHSLAAQFIKLLGSGALVGLLVSAAVAVLLSLALDRQLQKLILYIRDLVKKGQDVGWDQGSIYEFNRIGEEIDYIVSELFERRFELRDTNAKLEKTLKDKRTILYQLIQNQEQERSHLAQELHDELGQLLTAVRVETVLLEHQIPFDSPSLNHSTKIKQLVSDMYSTVYDRIMSLRPVELDELGLSQSIQQIPTLNSLRQTGVKVMLDIDEVKMPPGTEIHLYRIVQEALTNIMKHALATETSISLYNDENKIVLSIIDNGQGMHESKHSKKEHAGFGLLGMKERCEYIGASLSILSGGGVSLRVVVPLGNGEC
jgi:signal transduction histidine kinase